MATATQNGKTTRPFSPHHLRHAGLIVTSELVTPEKAANYLKINVENRKIRTFHVDVLADDMANGRYLPNGATLSFGVAEIDGRETEILFDGQHRLTAIVQSGMPQWMLVVRGVAREAHKTIDIGRIRGLSDHLGFDHYPNATLLASTLAVVQAYDDDKLRVRSSRNGSKSALYELLGREPEITESSSFLSSRRSPFYASSHAAALHHLVRREGGRHLADQFIEALRSDVGLSEGDPILSYQRWARNMATRNKGSVPRADRMAVLIKTFNAWASGSKAKHLSWRSDELFPVVTVPPALQGWDTVAAV